MTTLSVKESGAFSAPYGVKKYQTHLVLNIWYSLEFLH